MAGADLSAAVGLCPGASTGTASSGGEDPVSLSPSSSVHPSTPKHTPPALQGLTGKPNVAHAVMHECAAVSSECFDPSDHMQAGTWTVVWRTDDLDSDGALISGLAHVPGLPGLAGGDGHAGYLISAANQALNLYECSASGGCGEASLQVPAQPTPYPICLLLQYFQEQAVRHQAHRHCSETATVSYLEGSITSFYEVTWSAV